MDQIPKLCGLIPPIAVKNPISDIEKIGRNTSICSFFQKLEAISTLFPPKLPNMSPSLQSMEISYSDPKYDINISQNISTRRSKNLYELTVKMSKYKTKFVQMLEGSDDFRLPIHLQSKYQICYK
jgi:hypothetical protein